jgi:hypothetical protein
MYTHARAPEWIDLGDEDFTREAAKLAELVFTVSEVPR